jgi:hypothetical protein
MSAVAVEHVLRHSPLRQALDRVEPSTTAWGVADDGLSTLDQLDAVSRAQRLNISLARLAAEDTQGGGGQTTCRNARWARYSGARE